MLCCRQAMPCQPYRTTHSGGREARIHTHDRSADERAGSVGKQDENLSGQKSRRSLPAAIRIRMILTGNTDSGSFLIYCCKIANNRYIFVCGWFLGWGGFCSCQHPDGVDPDGRVGQLVADAGITDRQLIKANEFNAALTAGGKKQASVYVYHRHTIVRYPGEKGARKLAARIVLMGYTDVLLSVHPQNGKSFAELANKAWIRIFNSYLNSHNVRVHALMFSEASQFDRAKNKEIYIHASVIQQYNRTVHANERFAGASADWEPHSLKPNSTLSSEANLLMLDRWNNDRYGKHAANDRLLKRTLEMLALAKFYLDEIGRVYHLPELSLNEAINYSFQERQNKVYNGRPLQGCKCDGI